MYQESSRRNNETSKFCKALVRHYLENFVEVNIQGEVRLESVHRKSVRAVREMKIMSYDTKLSRPYLI